MSYCRTRSGVNALHKAARLCLNPAAARVKEIDAPFSRLERTGRVSLVFNTAGAEELTAAVLQSGLLMTKP